MLVLPCFLYHVQTSKKEHKINHNLTHINKVQHMDARVLFTNGKSPYIIVLHVQATNIPTSSLMASCRRVEVARVGGVLWRGDLAQLYTEGKY